MERPPFALTFPGMVPAGISGAPLLPYTHTVTFMLQSHANINPVLVIQFRGINIFNYFL